MSVLHPSLLMTVRSRYVSSAQIAAQRSALDLSADPDLTSHEIYVIWQALTAADDLFFSDTKDYQKAIDAYNYVSALILQFQDSAYSADDLRDITIVPEQSVAAVTALAVRSAATLKALRPREAARSRGVSHRRSQSPATP